MFIDGLKSINLDVSYDGLKRLGPFPDLYINAGNLTNYGSDHNYAKEYLLNLDGAFWSSLEGASIETPPENPTPEPETTTTTPEPNYICLPASPSEPLSWLGDGEETIKFQFDSGDGVMRLGNVQSTDGENPFALVNRELLPDETSEISLGYNTTSSNQFFHAHSKRRYNFEIPSGFAIRFFDVAKDSYSDYNYLTVNFTTSDSDNIVDSSFLPAGNTVGANWFTVDAIIDVYADFGTFSYEFLIESNLQTSGFGGTENFHYYTGCQPGVVATTTAPPIYTTSPPATTPPPTTTADPSVTTTTTIAPDVTLPPITTAPPTTTPDPDNEVLPDEGWPDSDVILAGVRNSKTHLPIGAFDFHRFIGHDVSQSLYFCSDFLKYSDRNNLYSSFVQAVPDPFRKFDQDYGLSLNLTNLENNEIVSISSISEFESFFLTDQNKMDFLELVGDKLHGTQFVADDFYGNCSSRVLSNSYVIVPDHTYRLISDKYRRLRERGLNINPLVLYINLFYPIGDSIYYYNNWQQEAFLTAFFRSAHIQQIPWARQIAKRVTQQYPEAKIASDDQPARISEVRPGETYHIFGDYEFFLHPKTRTNYYEPFFSATEFDYAEGPMQRFFWEYDPAYYPELYEGGTISVGINNPSDQSILYSTASYNDHPLDTDSVVVRDFINDQISMPTDHEFLELLSDQAIHDSTVISTKDGYFFDKENLGLTIDSDALSLYKLRVYHAQYLSSLDWGWYRGNVLDEFWRIQNPTSCQTSTETFAGFTKDECDAIAGSQYTHSTIFNNVDRSPVPYTALEMSEQARHIDFRIAKMLVGQLGQGIPGVFDFFAPPGPYNHYANVDFSGSHYNLGLEIRNKGFPFLDMAYDFRDDIWYYSDSVPATATETRQGLTADPRVISGITVPLVFNGTFQGFVSSYTNQVTPPFNLGPCSDWGEFYMGSDFGGASITDPIAVTATTANDTPFLIPESAVEQGLGAHSSSAGFYGADYYNRILGDLQRFAGNYDPQDWLDQTVNMYIGQNPYLIPYLLDSTDPPNAWLFRSNEVNYLRLQGLHELASSNSESLSNTFLEAELYYSTLGTCNRSAEVGHYIAEWQPMLNDSIDVYLDRSDLYFESGKLDIDRIVNYGGAFNPVFFSGDSNGILNIEKKTYEYWSPDYLQSSTPAMNSTDGAIPFKIKGLKSVVFYADSGHPIAFHNHGQTGKFSYSGDHLHATKVGLDGNTYDFYTGYLWCQVTDEFSPISYECYHHGYMGGSGNLIFEHESVFRQNTFGSFGNRYYNYIFKKPQSYQYYIATGDNPHLFNLEGEWLDNTKPQSGSNPWMHLPSVFTFPKIRNNLSGGRNGTVISSIDHMTGFSGLGDSEYHALPTHNPFTFFESNADQAVIYNDFRPSAFTISVEDYYKNYKQLSWSKTNPQNSGWFAVSETSAEDRFVFDLSHRYVKQSSQNSIHPIVFSGERYFREQNISVLDTTGEITFNNGLFYINNEPSSSGTNPFLLSGASVHTYNIDSLTENNAIIFLDQFVETITSGTSTALITGNYLNISASGNVSSGSFEFPPDSNEFYTGYYYGQNSTSGFLSISMNDAAQNLTNISYVSSNNGFDAGGSGNLVFDPITLNLESKLDHLNNTTAGKIFLYQTDLSGDQLNLTTESRNFDSNLSYRNELSYEYSSGDSETPRSRNTTGPYVTNFDYYNGYMLSGAYEGEVYDWERRELFKSRINGLIEYYGGGSDLSTDPNANRDFDSWSGELIDPWIVANFSGLALSTSRSNKSSAGVYVFYADSGHPIAFHNHGQTGKFSYSGDHIYATKVGLDGNTYDFYTGYFSGFVYDFFDPISFECYHHGYMGGSGALHYDAVASFYTGNQEVLRTKNIQPASDNFSGFLDTSSGYFQDWFTNFTDLDLQDFITIDQDFVESYTFVFPAIDSYVGSQSFTYENLFSGQGSDIEISFENDYHAPPIHYRHPNDSNYDVSLRSLVRDIIRVSNSYPNSLPSNFTDINYNRSTHYKSYDEALAQRMSFDTYGFYDLLSATRFNKTPHSSGYLNDEDNVFINHPLDEVAVDFYFKEGFGDFQNDGDKVFYLESFCDNFRGDTKNSYNKNALLVAADHYLLAHFLKTNPYYKGLTPENITGIDGMTTGFSSSIYNAILDENHYHGQFSQIKDIYHMSKVYSDDFTFVDGSAQDETGIDLFDFFSGLNFNIRSPIVEYNTGSYSVSNFDLKFEDLDFVIPTNTVDDYLNGTYNIPDLSCSDYYFSGGFSMEIHDREPEYDQLVSYDSSIDHINFRSFSANGIPVSLGLTGETGFIFHFTNQYNNNSSDPMRWALSGASGYEFYAKYPYSFCPFTLQNPEPIWKSKFIRISDGNEVFIEVSREPKVPDFCLTPVSPISVNVSKTPSIVDEYDYLYYFGDFGANDGIVPYTVGTYSQTFGADTFYYDTDPYPLARYNYQITSTGVYIFSGIPTDFPIAFLNHGKTGDFFYTGNNIAATETGLDGNLYNFYTGVVTATITGDFGRISYQTFQDGVVSGDDYFNHSDLDPQKHRRYMGGSGNLSFNPFCN